MSRLNYGAVMLLAPAVLRNAEAQNCTICEGNRTPIDPRQELNKGGTCGDVDSLVRTLSSDTCEDKALDIVVSGIRCGCRDKEQFPQCQLRQNEKCKLQSSLNESCRAQIYQKSSAKLCLFPTNQQFVRQVSWKAPLKNASAITFAGKSLSDVKIIQVND